jgi:uncharacterized membrane protein
MRPAAAAGKVGFMPENVAGALAYLTFLPAVIFLVLGPYNKNRFVRFHSLQCLLLWTAVLLMAVVLKLAGFILLYIPIAGPLFLVVISVVAGLAAFSLWVVLVIKALQGEMFKAPTLGDLAERHANPG